MDHTELGRAGELALDLYAMVSSDGELQLFTPIADDDHVDATAGRRGRMPALFPSPAGGGSGGGDPTL